MVLGKITVSGAVDFSLQVVDFVCLRLVPYFLQS